MMLMLFVAITMISKAMAEQEEENFGLYENDTIFYVKLPLEFLIMISFQRKFY